MPRRTTVAIWRAMADTTSGSTPCSRAWDSKRRPWARRQARAAVPLLPGLQVEADLVLHAVFHAASEAVQPEEPPEAPPPHVTSSDRTSRTASMARVLSSQPASSRARALRPAVEIS